MKNRKTVGLALGSGGVRGLAHIGVIKVLLKHKIPIDFIAGCSIGAWVGAHYALFQDIERLEEYTVGKKREKLYSFFDLSIKGGLIKGDKIQKLLNGWLGQAKFSDLKIPFSSVAANLITGEQVIFDKGNLAFGVRASMAVPDLFKPIIYKNKVLVDGGIINPVPDDVVKRMGADFIIAVNLDNYQQKGLFKRKDLSFIKTAWRTTEIMRHYLANYSMAHADVRIQPQLASYASWTEYFMHEIGQKIVRIGEREAERMMPIIKSKLGI